MTAIAAHEMPTRTVARRPFKLILIIGLSLFGLVGIGLGGVYIWRSQPTAPEAVVAIPWLKAPSLVGTEGKLTFQPKNGRGLSPAPDPRLIDPQPAGLLPKIADDGTRPLEFYARHQAPVSGALAAAPRIAILLTGAGIGQLATVEAMVKVPTNVSIALSPYSSDLERQAADIRSEGHEVLLDLPVRDPDAPLGSAGPHALADGLSIEENQQRLFWAMGRFPGFFGVSGQFMGRISQNGTARSALSEIQRRGLGLIDYPADDLSIQLDKDLQPKSIDEALQQLEQKANSRGMAIGVAGTTPLAIDRLRSWSAALASRGYRLVPVSALLHEDG